MGMNVFITTQGFATISMLTTVIGAVINIVLDPILIFGLNLGVRGAAIATLVSRCVELLIVIYYLKFREKQLCLTLKKLVLIDTSYIRAFLRKFSRSTFQSRYYSLFRIAYSSHHFGNLFH